MNLRTLAIPIVVVFAIASIAILSSGNRFYRIKNKLNRKVGYTKESSIVLHPDYLFGIDVSHYQGKIYWEQLSESKFPVKYVFIRATMGKNGSDYRFSENWQKSKQHNFIRGAYHYFRPNENADEQFRNYANTVVLKQGDFIPILDIEETGALSNKNLRKKVLRWLKLAEYKYGVKPMIYTNLSFYNDYLKGYVNGYPLWIAAYSNYYRVRRMGWKFHQFTDRLRIKGIKHYVDGNYFNGTVSDLKRLCKR